MQTAIRCMLMRAATSKGAYFLAEDLPRDPAARDRVLLSVMDSPDPRQVDDLGGAHRWRVRRRLSLAQPSLAPTSISCSSRSVSTSRCRYDVELRQHTRGAGPVRDRARLDQSRQHGDAGARAHPHHRHHRGSADRDAEWEGELRRHRAHRWRARTAAPIWRE